MVRILHVLVDVVLPGSLIKFYNSFCMLTIIATSAVDLRKFQSRLAY